jgi:hypothetical protein
MTTMFAHLTLQTFGYLAITDKDQPAMRCATSPSHTFFAPDWDSLVHYAENYQLCECGGHWLF